MQTFFIFCTGIILILGCLQVSGEYGIYCFQCNSLFDPDCENIQPNDTSSNFYKPCEVTPESMGREIFCRKIVQTIHDRDGLVRVIRKCGWIMHSTRDCYVVSNKGHQEVSCQCFYNGCNSSSRHFTTVYLILTACFFSTFFLKFSN